MNRRFRLNTHLTMPLELLAAPGGLHSRHEPGEVVELDADRCRNFDRFLNGRMRAGDLTELNDPPVLAVAPAAKASNARSDR